MRCCDGGVAAFGKDNNEAAGVCTLLLLLLKAQTFTAPHVVSLQYLGLQKERADAAMEWNVLMDSTLGNEVAAGTCHI